jgi:hypothetical protein
MAEAWHQTGDGFQLKSEQTKLRQGTAADGTALGGAPIVVDILVSAVANSPVAPGDRISEFASPVPGAKIGDPVFFGPTPGDGGPGDEMYGLTPGGACIPSDGSVHFILQNRLDAPIVLAADFRVRVCVLHILPKAPPPI